LFTQQLCPEAFLKKPLEPMKFLNPTPVLAVIAAAVSCLSQAFGQSIVCVETNLDSFCMELLQAQAPLATANFLRYVDDGDYTNTLLHSSVRNGYLVGGQWKASLTAEPIPTDPAVANETSIAQTRGTVALVTNPGQPNSAQSGFRINVSDNSASFNVGRFSPVCWVMALPWWIASPSCLSMRSMRAIWLRHHYCD
jgi:cyclophilin family peptidyl-prolyl cis-trans isomerase